MDKEVFLVLEMFVDDADQSSITLLFKPVFNHLSPRIFFQVRGATGKAMDERVKQ